MIYRLGYRRQFVNDRSRLLVRSIDGLLLKDID